MMPAIYICGTGNVGNALAEILIKNNIQVAGIFSRKKSDTLFNIPMVEYEKCVPKANSLVFICTPDSYIGETEKNLGVGDFIVIHCSGSVHLNVLQSKRKGVFYPLQSFTKNQAMDWNNLPILIEANCVEVENTLKNLVFNVGGNAVDATSEQREKIHLAAVVANNFSNAMFHISFYLANKSGLNPEILKPLIKQTVAKLENADPAANQTGPAKRGDIKTIQRHVELLKNEPEIEKIYQLLTNYISNWK